MLGFILAPRPDTIPPRIPNPAINLYLPLVANDFPPFVDVIELGYVDWEGYPGYQCAYGYVTGNTPTAIYSVTVQIQVTVYPYCPFDPCDPYSFTVGVHPVLAATLPDQKNPFSYCEMYTKSGIALDIMHLSSSSLIPPDGKAFYPLTVTSWTKQGTGWDTTVTGIVRNESGQRLAEIRVIGIAGLCSAKEADLGSRILLPGEETSFNFNAFYCGWSNPYTPPLEMVEISSQGVAEP